MFPTTMQEILLQKTPFTNSIERSPSRADSNGCVREYVFHLLLNLKAEFSNRNTSKSLESCQHSYSQV
jgi:hypothetical protein